MSIAGGAVAQRPLSADPATAPTKRTPRKRRMKAKADLVQRPEAR